MSEKKTVTISLPSISRKIAIPQVLTALLIISAFLIGVLYTKVQYLEGNNSANSAQLAQGNNPAANGNPQAVVAQAPTGKIKPVSDADHIRGPKDAKVSIVEYSDLECPFCKQFHPTMQNVLKTYGNKVNWVYRHFPLSFHQNAQKEAEASECVNELGGNDAFWSFIDKLFEKTTSNGTGFALDKLAPLAAEVGVNQTAFQKCLDDDKYAQHVKDDMADGTTGGVNGTPATFIVPSNGETKLISGAQPIEAFKTVIDQALSQ